MSKILLSGPLGALAALILAGCIERPNAGSPPSPTVVKPAARKVAQFFPFVDRAASLGIGFHYRNGDEAELSTILESLGGGLGWLDYDRDGWMDLVAAGGGEILSNEQVTGLPALLARSESGRVFASVGDKAQLQSSQLYSHGVAIGDYDNDGFQEILISGYGPPQLWHNQGDGTFLEVARPVGLTDPRWGSSAGWADFDGDGSLDVYLAHYVNWSFANHPYCASNDPKIREICPPRSFDALQHVVYFSQGDGTFKDKTVEAGLRSDGKGLGVLLCDVEPDGDVDIYVANDTTDNFLYLNAGQGEFSEEGLTRGVAVDDGGIPNGSMGLDVCDFNRDGKPDIWVTNYERESNALYRNEGHGQYLHVSQRMGITDLAGLFVGFGTACEDFDSDGDDDFIVANGHVIKYPVASPRRQLPVLLLFDDERFERSPSAAGNYLGEPHEGRGVATADFDADGDLDVAISHLDEPLALLVNDFHEENRWLSVHLVGTRSNRDATGARVELMTRAGTFARQVTGGGSYLSHKARAVHFALSDRPQASSLVVHWPSGTEQMLDASRLSGHITLVEPRDPDRQDLRVFLRETSR